ncbi:MAG: MarR family transcriptional regulator [bacterium]|nr:MarR family transcriptional regulator [bacterium]
MQNEKNDDRLLFLMSRTQHVLQNYLKNEFSAAGVKISPAQMGILFLLKLQNGQTMTELSRKLGIDNSTITGFIDRMVKAGFVTREQNPNDRRQNLITITEEGITEINKAKIVSNRVNEKVKEGFSPEEINIFKNVLNSFFIKFT